MTTGHYIAYVKSRQRQFRAGATASSAAEQRATRQSQSDEWWSCINGPTVRTVEEREVLMQEAYLLFYEQVV